MILFFLYLMGFNAQASEDWVRVRLWQEDNQIISLSGNVHRLQGMEKVNQFVAIPKKQNLTLKLENGHWLIEGFKEQAILIKEKLLAIEGTGLALNGRKAPGKVILSAQKEKVDVVGVLPLESYISGVIAHEMPSDWPLETLKAQAVAARSYAVALIQERKNKIYHLESTILDQVYSYLSTDELRTRFDRVTQAVDATWGQVLIKESHKPLKAYYHADCGGQTATTEEAWTSQENFVSVQDSSCPQSPRAEWRLTLSKEELGRKLKEFSPGGDLELKSLEVIVPAGRLRATEVRAEWADGSKRSIAAGKFREKIGYFDLKSTQFKVSKLGPNWIFEGRGFGHGVGLCQWGSRHLGQLGWDYKKIIRHYYPKAEIQAAIVQVANLKNQKQL